MFIFSVATSTKFFYLHFCHTFHSSSAILPIFRTTFTALCKPPFVPVSLKYALWVNPSLSLIPPLSLVSHLPPHILHMSHNPFKSLSYEILTRTKQQKLYSLLHFVPPRRCHYNHSSFTRLPPDILAPHPHFNPSDNPTTYSPSLPLCSSTTPLPPLPTHSTTPIPHTNLLSPFRLIFPYQTQTALLSVENCASLFSLHPQTNFGNVLIFTTFCTALGYMHFFTTLQLHLMKRTASLASAVETSHRMSVTC